MQLPGMGNGERDNALSQGRVVETVDTCECGPWTRASGYCDCGADAQGVVERIGEYIPSGSVVDEKPAGQRGKETTDGAPSFYFFETLLDEAHPSSKKFYDLVLEAALLHARKQKDYGRDSDPFSNVRASEEWGIEGWVGACVRLNDKVRRLQKLATRGELVNEAARDSFLDIAVYALIACVLYEEQASSC